MIKCHQIRLYPTKLQETFFKKSCGVARYSYNWALNKWRELYKEGKKTSAYPLIKLQNSIKKEQMPFFLEVGKTVPQYAIHHLEYAFKMFWKGKCKYPKFKKKGTKDSFIAVDHRDNFKQSDNKIWIPRLGWVKCAENLRFEGKVNYVAIKRIADMWFTVINIEIIPNETPISSENQTTVGVDLGIKSMIVLSDGTLFENPKALRNNLRRIKQRQRRFDKKQKGSKNKRKQQMRVARLHYKVTCIRKNAIHKATSFIVKKFDRIVIEELNVEKMIKNRKLSFHLNDVSFGEIARQLIYKAQWQGKEIVKADRFFASSKTCSKCNQKKKILKLSERIFKCDNCGFEIDRDINAAINLANYSPTLRLSESYAGGAINSSLETENRIAKKQEVVSILNKFKL